VLLTLGNNLSASIHELPRRSQAVEKVVVDPVGGPKEAENKAKTLQKQSI
jgi:hypothetical protein